MWFDYQYQNLIENIFQYGVWVKNERTGKRCLTIPHWEFVYEPDSPPPLLTVRKTAVVSAVAEMVGYIRGYTNAKQFSDIGTNTWWANADETEDWVNNPLRKGPGDMGKVYGAIGQDFGGIDLFDKVVTNLSRGYDDRGEIITFWKPDDFDKGCLRPCMYEHIFSSLGGELHLRSVQRSTDVCLGLPFNAVQSWWLLQMMSRVTGHEVGTARHTLNNVHIYEDHIDGAQLMLDRLPLRNIGLTAEIPDWVQSFDNVRNSDTHGRNYINVSGYETREQIKFEMAR